MKTESPFVSFFNHYFKRIIIDGIALITRQICRPRENFRGIHGVAERSDLCKHGVNAKLSAVVEHLGYLVPERILIAAVLVLHRKLGIGYPDRRDFFSRRFLFGFRFFNNAARAERQHRQQQTHHTLHIIPLEKLFFSRRTACTDSACPRPLKIKAAAYGIHIKNFTGTVKTAYKL